MLWKKSKDIMKNMPTIGLPKGLFYYEHHVLWERFFKNMGCNVILSEDTNKEILDYGVNCCGNDVCLPVKVFHGHVYSIKDQVDYIFIPRYTSVEKNEYTCPKFCGLPDMTRLNMKEQIKVLEIKMHMDKYPNQMYKSLKEIAKILDIKYKNVIEAYNEALHTFDTYQEKLLPVNNVIENDKPAISVLGHPYMIYDHYLSMKLIAKLMDKDFAVYTPKNLDKETKMQNAHPFQGKVFWNVGFDNLGSAFTFAENQNIKGIIYVTPFGCGIDSFVIEFIERRIQSHYKIPFLKLTVDEHTGEAGFDTRIEAFLDMIG
ncbi:MAG: acyl-CoA dehydratase activase-related protein [Bacillota bacterium]